MYRNRNIVLGEALALACLVLSSCASIPLTTALRLSSFSEQQFAGLRPEEVGIKIRLPQGFELDVSKSRLAIEVASNAGVHNAAFDLEQTGMRTVRLPGGLFSSQPGVEYELRLPVASRNRFHELQAFVVKAKVEDIGVRVMPKLAARPEGARSVEVWIDLRLKQAEGYLPLVDAATISLAK